VNEWRPDPHGRFPHRLFVDGVATPTVHDGQRQLFDPMSGAAVLPPPPPLPAPSMPSMTVAAFGAPTAPYAPATQTMPSPQPTQWQTPGLGITDTTGWADMHAAVTLAVPGGFAGGAAVGRPPRQPMRVTVKNKDLVVDDRAITFGAESIGFAEIDSVQYRENSGGVYAGRALVIAVGMVLGVVVVERGSSCPTLTFAGRGRKITVAMPLSGKKRANSVEAYALLADALSEDILPNAATAITSQLSTGQSIQLAGRTISSQGMSHKKGVHPWPTLRATAVIKGQIEFAFSGGSVKVPANRPNAFVLAAVAEAMQGRRLQLPRSLVSNTRKAPTKATSKKTTAIVCGLAAAMIIACVLLLKFG
jgi:hypothetical protein